LRECLRCLLVNPDRPRIILVDNASDDGTAAAVRAECPTVTLIENSENRGFATACNQGIRASSEPFVLLLNPDTVAEPSQLEKLLEVMQAQPAVGACGPRIINPDGSQQLSCRAFPTLGALACDELGLSALLPNSRWLAGYGRSACPLDATRNVDQLMGSCLLLRRAALEDVGLFDERFFVYFEEVDLCLRLKRAGWQVLFVHEATIVHVGGQSSKTDRLNSLRHRYRSLFVFYRKHHPRWQLAALKSIVQIGSLMRMLAGQHEYALIAKEVWKL
jgi:GT2 family glycosyltransferase